MRRVWTVRRVRVIALVALLFGASALPRPVASEAPSTAPAPLPIFDAHIHYSRPDWSQYPPERVFEILDRAGITRALVSSTPDDGTLMLYGKDPKRVVPILRPYRTRDDMGTWWNDPTVIPYLEGRLARGVYRGIGEFHLSGEQARSPIVKRVVELAAAKGLYLHAHSDDRAVALLFEQDPGCRIIWAHAGMSSGAKVVGELMDRHATLWADLSYRSGDVAPGGRLDPEWRSLLIRHADRFMLGSDTWATSRWESVPGLAAESRRALAQLPREVAEQIAFRNAERLFP